MEEHPFQHQSGVSVQKPQYPPPLWEAFKLVLSGASISKIVVCNEISESRITKVLSLASLKKERLNHEEAGKFYILVSIKGMKICRKANKPTGLFTIFNMNVLVGLRNSSNPSDSDSMYFLD